MLLPLFLLRKEKKAAVSNHRQRRTAELSGAGGATGRRRERHRRRFSASASSASSSYPTAAVPGVCANPKFANFWFFPIDSHIRRSRILMRRLNPRSPQSDSVIATANSTEMDPLKVPLRPRPNLFPRNPKHSSRFYLLILATTAIATAVLCCLFVLTRSYRSSIRRRYAIVMDGGSTGTRIHVFEYDVGKNGALGFDLQKGSLGTLKVNPGLSAYPEDPASAGGSLVELLEFAKANIPRPHWEETEIRLMTTAGLRLLELEAQERILESCRTVLRSSGFKFQDDWASVITGSDEGIYAWVIANHALGTLGSDPQKTTGIIELGGASAQVTFVSSEAVPPEYSHALRFGNMTYNLYSHSFLHFGQNVAFESLRESIASGELESSAESFQKLTPIDPCTPSGYTIDMDPWKLSRDSLSERNSALTLHASGNFSECRSAAQMLLQKGKERCSQKPCHSYPTFIPKLQGKFLATENMFYTAKFFGLTPRASLSNLMIAGQQFCEEDWSKLIRKYNSFDIEDLQRFCFSSAYIVTLLHDNLGIGLDDERIEFSNQVGDIPLDWAFGAFILQNSGGLEQPDWFNTTINDDLLRLLSLVLVCAVLMSIAWFIFKWKSPHLKTIYDLEKGRYIVMRVYRS